MIQRQLQLPAMPEESFLLWRPRQSGKSMLMNTAYPESIKYDLLNTDVSNFCFGFNLFSPVAHFERQIIYYLQTFSAKLRPIIKC
jgi:hypothetical protein